MTNTTFLMLLSAFSVLSGLVTEGIKKLCSDRANLPYNLMTLAASLIIGTAGCAVYYLLNHIPFTSDNVVYMILMGLAGGLISMVGFDKVKQMIAQLHDRT